MNCCFFDSRDICPKRSGETHRKLCGNDWMCCRMDTIVNAWKVWKNKSWFIILSPSRMASLGVRVRANPTIQKMESPPMDPQLVGHEHAHAYVSSALIDCLFACADQGGSLITIWYFWYVFSNFKSKRNDGNRRTTGSSYHHPLRVQLFACGSWWSRPHLPPAPGRVRMATRQCQDCAGRNLQWQFPPEN